jgi:hypothetical protein
MNIDRVDEIKSQFAPEEVTEYEFDPYVGEKVPSLSYAFINGGKNEFINKRIHTLASTRSYNSESIFIEAVDEYLNEERATAILFGAEIFNDLIRSVPIEEVFEDTYLSSLVTRSLSTNFKFKSINGTMMSIGLDSENLEKVKNYIFDAIKENKMQERLGLSHIIDYVVKSEFSYTKVAVRVANRVQEKINELEDIELQINTKESTLFSLSFEGDRGNYFYEVEQDYDKTEGHRVDSRALPKGATGRFEIPEKNNGNLNSGIVGISEPIVMFPSGVYDADSEAMEILRKDESLKDKDIRSYEFLNWQQQRDLDLEWLLPDIFQRTVPPEELVEINLRNNYARFILRLMADYQDDNQLENTIGGTYVNIFGNNFITMIYGYIAMDKEVNRRIAEFLKLVELSKDLDLDSGEKLTPEDLKEAELAGARGFTESVVDDPPPEPSEEDIENRQKYFKQCALMLNMPILRDVYQQKLVEQYKNDTPYHGRFITLRTDDKEQETMLSSLVSSGDEQRLFELETHKVSRLVPKIRLFKVFDDPTHGEKEIEFIFDRTSNIRTTFMDDNAFDKGTGVGLKNFSFEFNGTNPAEARNDIKANLTLFFQSFQDFTRVRKGYKKGDDYRYVDLVIQPKPDKEGKVGGIEIQSDRQYEPQFYRIRAEVGYVVPTEDEGFTTDEIKAIRVSNKSFFLNMVDHDISFGKDGTVEIKITYRAYLESLLKHPRLDALASPELIARRIENARTFTEQLNKRECSVEQIKELQVSLAAQESVLIKQSLSSIITRLRSRKVIYTTTIKKKDKEFFLKKGFFRKCELDKSSIEDGSDGADVKLVLNSDLPESSDDFDFIDSQNRSVQFFYFGDLLYTILDCVYEKGDKIRAGTGFDRNSIILGSFEFEPFQSKEAGTNVYNIADIPISVDFFSRWFVDNVVSQKSTRKTFPVLNFIRSLSNYLIKPSLIENCVNRKLETRLRFQTSQVSAYEEGGANPLLTKYALGEALTETRPTIALDVSTLRTSGELPFDGGPENDANSNFKDYHTFIVLSALGSTLTYAGNGDYSEDIEKGRFHVHVGQNAGLVKTLSLSKSDQQYIREARFFQNGIDGLLQLSAVYVANIEMFGNTLFYPGMEIFFNPYGIGGGTENDFDPREQGSIANRLGFGGYHTITSVKSSISPGKFTTSISAQQYYSGDGTGNPNIVKQRNADKEGKDIEGYTPENPENEDGFKNCKQVILNAQNYAFEEGTLAGRVGESSTDSVETPEEVVDEILGAQSEPAVEETLDATFGGESDTNDDSVSIVTGRSLGESPTEVETYTGQLRTMISSQSTTSSTGGQLTQQFTERGGTFIEMSDGTVYFQSIGANGVIGPKVIIRDHSRIIRQ